jgi:3-mercaptopyruvate sulfurtransferase SseA
VFRQNLATPEKLAELLGASGVDAAYEAVIVSDKGLNADSALAFLMLEKIGQKKVSVLADSLDDWAFAGFPVEKDTTAKVTATSYPVSLRADSPRAPGLYPKIYLASGKALPAKVPEGKVIHVPYTELVNADGKPKTAMEIWTILTKAGVSRYAEIVTVSDDPGEAAANYFILKMMGYPDIKVLPA